MFKIPIIYIVEDYERKADQTAFNWMIDYKLYQTIKKQNNNINNLNIIKSFYVYRLAHDKIINYNSSLYQEYNPLIEE